MPDLELMKTEEVLEYIKRLQFENQELQITTGFLTAALVKIEELKLENAILRRRLNHE
jgi:hypothetical protein